MIDIYLSRRPPLLGTLDVREIEQKARDKLKDQPGKFPPCREGNVLTFTGAFLYVFGSAGNCAAAEGNVNEF